jgi:hypothetical protein
MTTYGMGMEGVKGKKGHVTSTHQLKIHRVKKNQVNQQ